MAKIYYSVHEDKDIELFPIIKTLIQSFGRSSSGMVFPFRTEGNSIVYVDGNDEYVYSIGKMSVAREEEKVYMDQAGASWFKQMRGDGEPEPPIKASNHWKILLRKLSDSFYENNFFFSCDNTSEEVNNISDDKVKANVESILETFYPEEKGKFVLEVTNKKAQYVYAASLRFEVGKFGAPQPVLGRVYFTKNLDDTLDLLSVEDANKLDRSLEAVLGNNGGKDESAADSVDSTLNTLYAILNNREHLERNIVFNEQNERVIENIVDPSKGNRGDERAMEQDEEVQIEISKATVNTLFKIKVNAKTVNIYFNDFTHRKDPVLCADILFDKITLRCLVCKKELIHSSIVNYLDKAGEARKAELLFDGNKIKLRDPSTHNDIPYGEAIEAIKESVFRKHLLRVACESCGGRGSCVGYVCEGKQIVVKNLDDPDSSEPIIRCMDCVFPESFIVINNEAYTPNSVFYDVNDHSLRLVEDKNGERCTCEICGRDYFEKPENDPGVCALCASLSDTDPVAYGYQNVLYRKHKGFLPISTRLSAATKRCAEDQSVIVFKIGEKYYVFDKIDSLLKNTRTLTKTVSGKRGN
ncbi:MAG: hypothetical protein J5765_01820 [Clostridia bacterium]|nr:hypothetical protein [Clostridia bacterium]